MDTDIISINNIINTQVYFSEIEEEEENSNINEDEEYYLIKNTDIIDVIAIDEGWIKMTKVIII